MILRKNSEIRYNYHYEEAPWRNETNLSQQQEEEKCPHQICQQQQEDLQQQQETKRKLSFVASGLDRQQQVS